MGVEGGCRQPVQRNRSCGCRLIIRIDCGVARFGPTTPKRARRLADASVDPTDARYAKVEEIV
jgi:hypothetical protein